MITFESKGSWDDTTKWLKKVSSGEIFKLLDRYGREGVNALANATPIETGLSAQSWDYEVKLSRGFYRITWTNTNLVNGVPVVILLQYGHGTGTGGYVQGYDFINPAMRPLFDRIANDVWKAVTSA